MNRSSPFAHDRLSRDGIFLADARLCGDLASDHSLIVWHSADRVKKYDRLIVLLTLRVLSALGS